ncbi:MAG: glycosyl hydrolase family 98 carbohydrate binding module [Planctomycetota bacterium]|nr:MAG: glycosyl hydrolase family 98 carbohydrate binding module [Planctomycetota bacterium]
MNFLSAVLLTVLAAPPVEVVSFQGEPRVGEWRGLTDGRVNLSIAGKDEAVPLDEVLEVRFRGEPAKLDKPAAVVSLWDGSKLGATQTQIVGKQLKLTSATLGELSLPQNDVASVRFSDRFDEDEQWVKLVEKASKSDLLVIRKEQTLDFLDGVVVEVTDKSVKFLLDGEEVSTKREKVFGLIFARRTNTAKSPAVRLELSNGDVLMAASVAGTDRGVSVTTASKSELALPLEQLKRIDFSQGKLRYLSQDPPRDVKYVRGIQDGPAFVQDRAFYAPELKPMGLRAFSRGLCIRPQTTLRYRLGGEYRRFQAIVGIDESVKDGNGDCDLMISGDGKQLVKLRMTSRDIARPIDLDVADVVVLEITVGFGGDAATNVDLGDNFDLADAKLIK